MTSMPSGSLLATAKSIARTTSLVKPAPVASSTFRTTSWTFGREPAVRPVGRQRARAGDRAGHVGAVAVVVVGGGRLGLAVGEVVERFHAPLELRRHLEPRVDHRHGDAAARPRILQAEGGPEHRGRHRLASVRVVERWVEDVDERVQQPAHGAGQDADSSTDRLGQGAEQSARAGRRSAARRHRPRCRSRRWISPAPRARRPGRPRSACRHRVRPSRRGPARRAVCGPRRGWPASCESTPGECRRRAGPRPTVAGRPASSGAGPR